MTDPNPRRATPEQWETVQVYEDNNPQSPWSTASCLLELRDRLAAAEQRISELQAAHNVETNWQSEQDDRLRMTDERLANLENAPDRPAGAAPTGSLVEVMTNLLGHYGTGTARAAILAVADWLDSVGNNGSARELRKEVERG